MISGFITRTDTRLVGYISKWCTFPSVTTNNSQMGGFYFLVLYIRRTDIGKGPWSCLRVNLSVFQVILVSANKLTRYIEPCQLTDEFGGSLVYDHLDWVNKRLVSTKLLYLLVDYNNSELLWLVGLSDVYSHDLASDIKLSKIVNIRGLF